MQQKTNAILGGHLGKAMSQCIENSVKVQDIAMIVEPFGNRTETSLWQTEFWGKWMLGAVPAYRYSGDTQLLSKICQSVSDLVATQTDDGYIGNYADGARLGNWDVWGRKYTLLGLLEYYDLTLQTDVLNAAVRLVDNLLNELSAAHAEIVTFGFYRGMAASSVLEPIVKLYTRTKDQKYLNFAKEIVSQWESTDGPQLIRKAVDGVNVADRFPHPSNWFSEENGQKAYEMMSCYQGLLELYTVTGCAEYLHATECAVRNIIESEINVAGSGSAFECWYHGAQNQILPTFHTMETCVTTTWMRLCQTLMMLTRDPAYADMLERTLYNAYLAAMSPDASSFSKYSPLEGTRGAGEDQCGLTTNCCIANGPRGFMVLPSTVVTSDETGIYINLYTESVVNTRSSVSGNSVIITQNTDYPANGTVSVVVQTETPDAFLVHFRIPAWSYLTSMTVNGDEVEDLIPGSYKVLERVWKSGDTVTLVLDMRGRVVEQSNHFAIERGPIVLARDARFDEGYIDECAVVSDESSAYAQLEREVNGTPENIWMSFTTPLLLGSNREREFGEPKPVHMCDFASAGNTWDQRSRYRVWLPKTLNVMLQEYKPY